MRLAYKALILRIALCTAKENALLLDISLPAALCLIHFFFPCVLCLAAVKSWRSSSMPFVTPEVLHVPRSSFTSHSRGRQPSQWLVMAKPATSLLVQQTAFLLGAPHRLQCCRPPLQTPTQTSHQAETKGSAHGTCCSRSVCFFLLSDIV